MENGEIIKVKVTDTPGQENFNSLLNCLKNAQGIIIIYDVTDKKSFEYANEWINDIKNGLSFNTQLLLARNKKDLEEGREVQTEEGEKLAEESGILFSECSAKTGENINFIFNRLISKISGYEG